VVLIDHLKRELPTFLVIFRLGVWPTLLGCRLGLLPISMQGILLAHQDLPAYPVSRPTLSLWLPELKLSMAHRMCPYRVEASRIQ
jgi:hypothetical protein